MGPLQWVPSLLSSVMTHQRQIARGKILVQQLSGMISFSWGTKGHGELNIWVKDGGWRAVGGSRNSNGENGGLRKTKHSCKDKGETESSKETIISPEIICLTVFWKILSCSVRVTVVISSRAPCCDENRAGSFCILSWHRCPESTKCIVLPRLYCRVLNLSD